MYYEDKIILDLCGESGAWSEDYAEKGYDLRLIDEEKEKANGKKD